MNYSYGTPERFWSRVDRSGGADACWLWTGSTNHFGYGTVRFRNGHWKAHRLAYTLTKGEVPDGLHVIHSCDCRPCCNPKHLRAGTAKDNIDDMLSRGRNRHPLGELNGVSKLTASNVMAIRNSKQSCAIAARRYGVNESTVRAARHRKTWRHV